MDKVQKHNSFNTNTPSSEAYKNLYWDVTLDYEMGKTCKELVKAHFRVIF
jgi:hypothetical protein